MSTIRLPSNNHLTLISSNILHYEKFADGTVECIEAQIPFELPNGWAWSKINNIAFVTKLAGFEYSKYIAPTLCEDGIPLFKGKNVQDSKIIYEFESFIPESISNELSRSQVTRKCILTPYVGTIGNIGIHDKVGKFHLGSNVGKIELYNSCVVLMEEYVVTYLKSSFGYKQLTKHMKATAQASISIEAIRDVYIPIPPENEQQRMWSAISESLTLIENIESYEGDIADMVKLAKSKILDLAIRGKLVPQNPDDEPASVLLERVRAEKEELIKQGKIKRDKKESVIFKGEDNSYYLIQNERAIPADETIVFDLPDSWCWTTLPTIANVELGKTLDRAKNTGMLYPYLRSVNIKWGDIDLSDLNETRFEDDEREKYSVIKNDLLICEGGDVGRCCVWNIDEVFLYQNALHRARMYANIEPKFYQYVLMSYESKGILKRISNGVTIKHLTGTTLSFMPIPLPPVDEQLRIIETIELLFAQLDAIKESLN